MSNIYKIIIKFVWNFLITNDCLSSFLFGSLLSNSLISFPFTSRILKIILKKLSKMIFFTFWNQLVDLFPVNFHLSYQNISCFRKYFYRVYLYYNRSCCCLRYPRFFLTFCFFLWQYFMRYIFINLWEIFSWNVSYIMLQYLYCNRSRFLSYSRS